MPSKNHRVGYLEIDHRNSPGVSADFVRRSGKNAPAVAEGKRFEADVLTCRHCQQQMILNPQRKRARGYCPGCDGFICDVCEAIRTKAGGRCDSFSKLVDQMYGSNIAQQQSAMRTIQFLRGSVAR